MTSTDLVTIEQVEDVLLHGGEMDIVSPDAVQEDMVRQILAAETVDEAFSGFSATPAAELEGVKLTVRGIAWMRSAFKEGPQVYALLDCVVDETGEHVTVSMGGRSLMASFVWAQRQEAMPLTGTFRREQSNSNTERKFWLFKLA